MSDYPEHDKLSQINDKSQAVGEFLDWLQHERGLYLAEYHEHADGCECDDAYHDDEGEPREPFSPGCPLCGHVYHRGYTCGRGERRLYVAHVLVDDLLAEFFEIDRYRLESEKRAMLREMRGASAGTTKEGA